MINDIQRALNRRLDEMSSISSRWVSTWLKLDEVQCTAIIDWIGLKESTWNRFGCINMAVQLVKYTKGNATSRFVGWMASAALLLARRWSKINDGYVFRLSNSLSLSLSLGCLLIGFNRVSMTHFFLNFRAPRSMANRRRPWVNLEYFFFTGFTFFVFYYWPLLKGFTVVMGFIHRDWVLLGFTDSKRPRVRCYWVFFMDHWRFYANFLKLRAGFIG